MPQLPRSSESRRNRGFVRLITDVDNYAPAGLQFRGQLLTPGTAFNASDLPRPAVLIEYAGRVPLQTRSAKRRRFSSLWLLWRFDFETGEWLEVIRSLSDDASWSIDFAPIASRLLEEENPRFREERASIEAERMIEQLRADLGQMTSGVRCHVLGALDAFLAAEIVRALTPLSVVRSEDGYPRWGARKPSGLAA